MKRYKERRKILNTITSCDLPEDINIHAIEKMSLQSRKYDEIHPNINYWYNENDPNDINVNIENMWMALAEGLSKIAKCPKYSPDFELFLKEKTYEKCLYRLRQSAYGLTEESIIELEQIYQPSEGTSSLQLEDDVVGGYMESSARGIEILHQSSNGTTNSRWNADVEQRNEITPTAPTQVSSSTIEHNSQIRDYTASHPAHFNERISPSHNRTVVSSGGQPNPETGERAERWLKEKLEEIDYKVERTGIGSDYEVEINGQSALIEVKHIQTESGDIFWSQIQIETAIQCQEGSMNYFIAVVRGSDEPKVYWFWDPLRDFIGMDRTLTWEKRSERRPLDVEDGWSFDIDSLPKEALMWKDPTYSVRIKIDIKILEQEESKKGFDCLQDKLLEVP